MKYQSVLIIVLIPIAIIFSNLAFLVGSHDFYQQIFKEQDIYNDFNNENVLNNQTKILTGYFRGKNMLDVNYYSEQAVAHLKDVKYLLNKAELATYGSILLLIFATASLVNKKEIKNLEKAIIRGAALTIILTVVIAATLSTNFQSIFIYFHLALFRNNYWLFEESDNLIKMFPQRFFVSFAYHLVTNIIITALVLLLAALILKKINDKPHT